MTQETQRDVALKAFGLAQVTHFGVPQAETETFNIATFSAGGVTANPTPLLKGAVRIVFVHHLSPPDDRQVPLTTFGFFLW